MKRFLLTCTLFLVACTVFAAAPIITSFSPVSGRAGTLVTISGSNLDNSTSVTVGGVAAIAISNTGSKLVAMVMPGATTAPVTVITLSGSTTGPGTFKVNAATYPKYQIGGKFSGADAASYSEFGDALSLSADGSTAAIGGFNDNQIGGVWIFVRNGATWVLQQGNKIVPSDYTGNSYIGSGVALSADGNTMIMGGNRGAWIYSRNNGTWTQQTNRLTGSDAIPNNDIFFDNIIWRGYTVSISADGVNALISSATDANHQGAAWAYSKTGTTWAQQGGKITPSGSTGTKVAFGYSISMSADGLTAVIGSPGDDSSTGAAYIFTRTTGNWTQQGNKIIATDYVGPSSQGASVAVTANGKMIVVGGPGNAGGTGATWVYTRAGNTWAQQAKLVSSGIISAQSDGLRQGYCVATNADGTVLLQSSPSENEAGAAWVYTRINTSWTQVGKLPGSGGISQIGLALSADGSNALTGDIADNNIKGTVCAFSNLSFPVPITGIASNITTTTATISGTVDDNGSSTAVNMEYSTSANMTGSIVAALTTGTTPIAAGSGNSNFTSKLTGLLPGTTYYYRINGTNATGANTGEVLSFLTLTPPVVSSFAPSTSGVGTTIVITGVNLDNVTAVSIGGVAAAAFNRVSSTTIYATVGAGAGSGNVTVTNGYGTGSLAGFTLDAAPIISYPSIPAYDITKQISPVIPNNKGGQVPAATYLQVITPVFENLNGNTQAFYSPVSSTVDPLGNIYVADGSVVKKLAPNNQVRIYATYVNNAANTTMYPAGLAVDATGNIFASDPTANRIIKISPADMNAYAEFFAGNGAKGSVNGSLTAASFNSPAGLVFDTKGNLYVADQGGNLIRKITPAGMVSTFAGSGKAGATNSTGVNASFNAPSGLTIDANGNIYVADKGNNAIRMITPAGLVTTLAGTGAAGSADGTADAATFNSPTGVAADRNNNIYVADAGNRLIRIINAAGIVNTAAGNTITFPADGIGTGASFKKPIGVTCDLQGNLIVSDSTNVRKMAITGYTSNPALPPGLSLNAANGTISGTPTAITNGSYTIKAVNVNGTGTTTIKITTVIPPVPPGIKTFNPYVCKPGTKITITGINVLGATGVTIGGVPASSFTVISASTITADVPSGATSGRIVVTNQYGSTAVKGLVISSPPKIAYSAGTNYPVGTAITPINVKNSGGAVPYNIYLQATTLAGSGQPGLANGTGTAASFTYPTSTVADDVGNVYVTEARDNLIRKITPAGEVTTFAGSGQAGNADGNGTAASFNYPYRLAIDALNNLYVTDGYDNGLIRKITPVGVVTTLAKGFKGAGLTVAADGTVYIANETYSLIRKVTATGAQSTYVGGPVAGYKNGSIYDSNSPMFDQPSGIVTDPAGNFYITDAGNNLVRKISSGGVVSDLAGNGRGYVDGPPFTAKFATLAAIAIDPTGNLYIPDTYNDAIRKITPAGEVTTFLGNGIAGSTNGIGKAISVHTPQDLSVDANGNIYMADLTSYTIRKVTTTGYTVTPDLPAGLTIDGAGKISGVPTVITPATTYTITGYNVAGSSSTTINFSTVATKIPPVITSFSPKSGAVGTLVTITGSNLNYPTVKIGGVNALVVSNTGTELKCLVMPGAATGGVSVSTTAGAPGSAGNFKVTDTPYPTIQQGKKLTGTQGSIGTAIAISADGNTILTTLASQNNQVAVFFTRNNGIWTEQKLGLTALDNFGTQFFSLDNTVALSADGTTAAIGVPRYWLYNDGKPYGAVFTFVKEKGVWKQVGIRLSGSDHIASTLQGSSIAISADGNTIIEGSPDDDNNNGAAWIFSRTNGIWTQQGTKLVGTGSVGAARQGYAVNISADGNTAIVGGTYDNNTTGAAWIFTKTGDNWAQQGTKLINPANSTAARQGSSVALSADGNTAIVGETGSPGGANIFVRTGATWDLQGPELIGTGYYSIVHQGRAVALSADGNTATMAGLISGYTVDANQSLLWVFTRSGNKWKSVGSFGGIDFVNPNNNTDNNFYTTLSPDGSTAVMNTDFQDALWVFVAATPASATTQAATAVGGTTATLSGVVNDGGQKTSVTIEYGTSPTLAGAKTATLTTGVSPILPATGNVSFTSNLINLIQGTTYYFRIKCVSGSSALLGDILSFTTIPSPPTITSFTPTSTITGTEITVTGTNFITVTDVSFGGTPATSFNVVSPTMITAIVGAGTSGKVAVATTGGTATLAGFNWVFTLPANNFTITANSASCRGSANGSITIAAAQQLNYTVTLTGGNMNNAYSFTDVETISNLAAGTYNLCFKVAGQSSYSQCFDIVITEPKDLAMYAAINKNASNITLTLDGASTYYITLNGTTVTTTQNIITLALNKGSNDIAITSDKPCQGSLEKKFTIADDFSAFPNPFNTTLNINVGPDNLAKATLQLYNIMGTKVYSQQFSNISGIISINPGNLVQGTYMLKLLTGQTEKMIKVVKQ